MSTPRATFSWSPGVASASQEVDLGERLAPLAEDRASTAADLVREGCEVLLDWLAADDAHLSDAAAGDAGWGEARALLENHLAGFAESQGWRGPAAGWLATLDALVARGAGEEYAAPAREILAEELGLWLGGEGAGEGPWDGEPLAAGRRLPDRAACGRALLDELQRGEVIVVHGWSETVALALEQVQRRGLAPEVVLGEGSPDLAGRRMAERLADSGVRRRLVYDAALCGALARADRLWIGTEAIGAHALLARVGTRALFDEARRSEVPTTVLATGDKLLPGGELTLPGWCAEAGWLLWERAPEGVRVESQAYEALPLDLPDYFATEYGQLSAAELSLQALRTH